MGNFLRKLFFANLRDNSSAGSSFQNHVNRIRGIWNNVHPHHYNSIGIERLIQLLLLIVQFVFLGLYIRTFFSRYGMLAKNLSIELYVVCKLLLVCSILCFQFFECQWTMIGNNSFFIYLVWYLSAETLLYIPTMLFCAHVFVNRRSTGRSAILLFINYIELIFTFALTYASSRSLLHVDKTPVTQISEYIYFSVTTSCAMDFGDIMPGNHFARMCIIYQAIIFIIFGAVLLNILLTNDEKNITLESSS